MTKNKFGIYTLSIFKWFAIIFGITLIGTFIFALIESKQPGMGMLGIIIMGKGFIIGLPTALVLGIIAGIIDTKRKLKKK